MVVSELFLYVRRFQFSKVNSFATYKRTQFSQSNFSKKKIKSKLKIS